LRHTREIPGNGIDDDANGYVDDVWGANTVSGAGDAHDDEGHGTHVAGIIAATANNSIGGVGLAPAATIMPVKVLDSRRAGTASGLAAGVRYAVANGARIINASVNGDGASQVLQEAIAEAHAAGVTVVASAGNNSRDIDVAPSYPASYPEANVLSVTAVDEGGLLPSFANRGPRGVDLAAPGTDILSTARGSGFERRSGTSMAAPFVAGALALLGDARPDLPAAEARAALLGTARAQSGLAGLIGTGRLDAAGGLRRVLGAARRQPAVAAASAPVARRAVAKKRTVRPALRTPRRVRAGRVALRWSRGTTSGVRRWRVALDGRRVATVRAGRALHIRTAVRPGRHRYSVTGLDGAGRRVAVAVKRFRAVRPRR
jgi:subtilisin family serine protease